MYRIFENDLFKKLFVVHVLELFGSSLQGESGLLFRIHSISQSIVISDSLWYVLSFVLVFMALLGNLIRDSDDPLIQVD